MAKSSPHTFHIPVMGLGYTIDTPAKVAKYGIDSVVSIMEDNMIEKMRKVYSEKFGFHYTPITEKDEDYRANRITEYLNLLYDIVVIQIQKIKNEKIRLSSDLDSYFSLLPENTAAKKLYLSLFSKSGDAQSDELFESIVPGAIDVNIMTKVDKTNYDENGDPLPNEFSDASSALRGFAKSKLDSAVIFSAGMNPRLYSYCEQFEDIYPDNEGKLRKKIILKVSDYRSALIQGKIFAKKGIWVSEFRIESGLNCGGHAFATQGFLFGPILQEFKDKKEDLKQEMFQLCQAALLEKGKLLFDHVPELKIKAQGGIGTAEENEFLTQTYNLDGTGWGSPFLLVPETTNVDPETMKNLMDSKLSDFYISDSSPLGVPYNNFRKTSADAAREKRISIGRPGSPCYKKFLSFNTEFTEKPICTASRQYQKLKIDQINGSDQTAEQKKEAINKVTVKECLCEGLTTSALIMNGAPLSHNLTAVSICPGPNLAFFKRSYKLSEMVDHIYGRANILRNTQRPHMFFNEAQLYFDYLKKEVESNWEVFTDKQRTYYTDFKENLIEGLNYYVQLFNSAKSNITENSKSEVINQLVSLREKLKSYSFLQALPVS